MTPTPAFSYEYYDLFWSTSVNGCFWSKMRYFCKNGLQLWQNSTLLNCSQRSTTSLVLRRNSNTFYIFDTHSRLSLFLITVLVSGGFVIILFSKILVLNPTIHQLRPSNCCLVKVKEEGFDNILKREFQATFLPVSKIVKPLIKGALSGLRRFLATESRLKLMKNSSLFHLKSFFVLKIFNFLSWIFGTVKKRSMKFGQLAEYNLRRSCFFLFYGIAPFSSALSFTLVLF